MQITSSIAGAKPATSFRVTGQTENARIQANQDKAEKSQKDKKNSKNISMAESDLVQNSNRVENIIKRYEKQRELVQKQIEQVNKNETMTVEQKKDRLAELTEKMKMLEDEKTAAIFEENQKKLEEERRKQEELKEKKEIKEDKNKEGSKTEEAKDMEHALKIGLNYSRIRKFSQTKAEMSRQAGRIEGEIANDIMKNGGANSYSEAKIKAEAGANPYRPNDWKMKQYHKLTKGIEGLDNALKGEIAEVNKESIKYGKLKVEFAKAEATNDEDKDKINATDNETKQETENVNIEEIIIEAENSEQNSGSADESKNENQAVNDAHSKYKTSKGKNIDKKGTVIDTDL